jgi:hypothetical protein
MANAPKRLQIAFEDVMARADNEMQEKYLADFPEWSLRMRQLSGKDDASVRPAPYQEELRRPVSVTTGLVVCPTLVSGNEILSGVNVGDELAVVADDNRDFLPPVMTYEDEDRKVDEALRKIVEEAELSPAGKKELEKILKERRAAFGMQLRKVNFNQEPVHTYTTGELPEHAAAHHSGPESARCANYVGGGDGGARNDRRSYQLRAREGAPD